MLDKKPRPHGLSLAVVLSRTIPIVTSAAEVGLYEIGVNEQIRIRKANGAWQPRRSPLGKIEW
jgi:hypothetical protein